MSYQYSLNNLRTNSPYYSLNNLNTENGIKTITAIPPIISTTVGSTTDIELYESSPDVISFSNYNKSLDVINLIASTSIYSAGSLNAPNAFIDCNGINSVGNNPIRTTHHFTGSQIFVNTGTFIKGIKTQNLEVDGNATINNLIISGATIPYFRFTTATGTNLYASMMSGTNGYFKQINSSLADSCQFEYFRAGSAVVTPSVNLSNGYFGTTNLNSIEIVPGNNEVVYFRRGIADSTNQIVIDPTNGSLYCPTGYFIGLTASSTETSYLKWSLTATGATAYIQDAYIQNLYAKNTIATGTFKGNFKVKNADSIEFLSSTNSQICQITPSATTTPPSLSYSTTALVGGQLQMTMTTNGTTLSQCNDISSQTLQTLTRADIKQASINYVGSVSNDLTVNGKASVGYLVAAPTNGLIVSGNTSIGTASNVNKLDVSGGTALGTYGGVNTAPSNGLIVSGNIGVGTSSAAQKLTVSGDMSVNTNAWMNLLNLGGTLSTASKGFELDMKGYARFYTHLNSNGFQLDIGSSGPYSNFRSGFFYKPDASFSTDKTLYITNQDGADATNTYRGAIGLYPNNGSLGAFTVYGNGLAEISAKTSNDYALTIYQNNPTNGYGMRLNSPNNGLYLAQFNGKIDDGTFQTALTIHSQGNNNGAVIIGAYPVAPSNSYKLWVAPLKNNINEDTFIGIANNTFRNNGSTWFGMTTGAVSVIQTTNSNNHIDIIPYYSQRARFAANGEIFLNGMSTTTSSSANSTLTLTSVPYYGGGGTSYHTTNGLGSLIPLVNLYFNAGFAYPAANNLLAATEYYRTDHSAWQGAPVQQLRTDWSGVYSIKTNITVQHDTAGGAYITFSIWKDGSAYTIQTQSNSLANGYISFNISQDIYCGVGSYLQFYLYVSAGNAYVLGNSNTSIRHIG